MARSLDAADVVVASELTLVDCNRVLIRAEALQLAAPQDLAFRRSLLAETAVTWGILRLHESILERARHAFPVEPVRTLDALHLASALLARSAMPEVHVLSLDRRVRDNAHALGFPLLPAPLASA